MRATFTEANIAAIKDFDPELARKAQIAYDHKLPINFQQLEQIEETLPRLLKEKEQLETARQVVAALPPGKYELTSDVSAVKPQPGQLDSEGTLWELAELKYPSLVADVGNKKLSE